MKPIIILYSNSGTTRNLAEKINGKVNCKIAEIKPKVPYGTYFAALKRSLSENKKHIIAEYEAPQLDLSNIDTIFIGYPLWSSDAPPFVLDYLKNQNLAGKTIIPFSTSGASNIRASLKKLQAAVGKAEIKLPYNCGKFKKDNFDKWIAEVSKL